MNSSAHSPYVRFLLLVSFLLLPALAATTLEFTPPQYNTECSSCPNDCSGHGDCISGEEVDKCFCKCDQGFDEEDCSKQRGETNKNEEIILAVVFSMVGLLAGAAIFSVVIYCGYKRHKAMEQVFHMDDTISTSALEVSVNSDTEESFLSED